MLGKKQGSFQLVVSTDGENSFASFIYSDPGTIFSNVLSLKAVIGFDNGERITGSDYGLFLMKNNRTLPAVNTFRIDGNVCSIHLCTLRFLHDGSIVN